MSTPFTQKPEAGPLSGVSSTKMPAVEAGWRLHRALVAVLLLILVARVLVPALGEANFGIGFDGDELVVRDWASHRQFAAAFWRGQTDYSLASHLEMTNRWAGRAVDRALPFGYSPTMLWLLAPFAALPSVVAFLVWTLLSAAAIWWLTRREFSIFVVSALILLSPLGFYCLALGQSALLSAAAILFLIVRQRDKYAHGECWSWFIAIDALVLWALTAKPPLAIVAGAGLLAFRRWRTVGAAVLMTVVSTVALTPLLGWNWPSEYLHLITNYDRETAPVEFAWSLRPDHMSNLRAVLWSSGLVGDHLACRISTGLWLLATGAAVAVAWRKRRFAEFTWLVAIAAYLLFCPHVTSTEDLLLVVPLAWLVVSRGISHFSLAGLVVVACALAIAFLAPGQAVPLGFWRSASLLALKAAALAAAWCAMRKRPLPKKTANCSAFATV